MNKPLVHSFDLNPDAGGGEGLMLHTTFHDANDGKFPNEVEVFSTQELLMYSYGNSAAFNIGGYFNPVTLRKLADELERSEASAVKELTKRAAANLK